MQAKAPAEPETAAAEKPAVRTVHDWHPEPLLCKRFNVADPYQGQREAPKAAGGMGEQMLSVPPHERGNAYAAALPDFMRPGAAAEVAAGGQEGGWEEELPPPPPRAAGGGPAAAVAATDGPDLDQVADEILASVDADFAKQVEEVCHGTNFGANLHACVECIECRRGGARPEGTIRLRRLMVGHGCVLMPCDVLQHHSMLPAAVTSIDCAERSHSSHANSRGHLFGTILL